MTLQWRCGKTAENESNYLVKRLSACERVDEVAGCPQRCVGRWNQFEPGRSTSNTKST